MFTVKRCEVNVMLIVLKGLRPILEKLANILYNSSRFLSCSSSKRSSHMIKASDNLDISTEKHVIQLYGIEVVLVIVYILVCLDIVNK